MRRDKERNIGGGEQVGPKDPDIEHIEIRSRNWDQFRNPKKGIRKINGDRKLVEPAGTSVQIPVSKNDRTFWRARNYYFNACQKVLYRLLTAEHSRLVWFLEHKSVHRKTFKLKTTKDHMHHKNHLKLRILKKIGVKCSSFLVRPKLWLTSDAGWNDTKDPKKPVNLSKRQFGEMYFKWTFFSPDAYCPSRTLG